MSVTINGTDGLVFADASTQNTAATGFGFKNRILNGNMVIDQRNAGASVSTASNFNGYATDRWGWQVTSLGKITLQQNAGSVTPPTGYKNYLGVTSTSAYSVTSTDYFAIVQAIEGFNVADLNWGSASAASVSVSFLARSSLTGTFGGVVYNAAFTRSYPFTYTISSANTWEQKTITIAGDTTGTWATDNTGGLYLSFGLGAGSAVTGTAGTWSASGYRGATGATSVVGTNGATFYITGVQLEKGSTATSFDYRPYGTELALCQRYYYKNTQGSGNSVFLVGVISAPTNANRCGMQFPVTMRAEPTVSYGGSGNPRIYDGLSSSAITSILQTSSTTNSAAIELQASGGGFAAGRCAVIIDGIAAFFAFSAEL